MTDFEFFEHGNIGLFNFGHQLVAERWQVYLYRFVFYFNYIALFAAQRAAGNEYPVINVHRRFFELNIMVFLQELADGIDFFVSYDGRIAEPVHKIDDPVGLFYQGVFNGGGMHKYIGGKQRFFQQFFPV